MDISSAIVAMSIAIVAIVSPLVLPFMAFSIAITGIH